MPRQKAELGEICQPAEFGNKLNLVTLKLIALPGKCRGRGDWKQQCYIMTV